MITRVGWERWSVRCDQCSKEAFVAEGPSYAKVQWNLPAKGWTAREDSRGMDIHIGPKCLRAS